MIETEQKRPLTGEVLPPSPNLPAVIPVPVPVAARPGRFGGLALALVLACAGAGAVYWRLHALPALPAGLVSGNGRLEADPVDIDSKYAGRIAEIRADEGDFVNAGQVLAIMDTRDVQAQLRQAQQHVAQAQHMLEQARFSQQEQQRVVDLAQRELDRTTFLAPKGFATVELLDQRKQQLAGANDRRRALEAAEHAAERAVDAATHQVEYYGVVIADSLLRAPKDGPIEYRIANVGEVVPAGGKVFTMLDASYVYMDIYLPTADAGRVKLGAEARIVLDAYSNRPIPAHIVFVASQAQFTPRTVETRSERDKLMFRVRARIDPARIAGRERLVRTGLPGAGYVRVEDSAVWPAYLQPAPPAARPAAAEP